MQKLRLLLLTVFCSTIQVYVIGQSQPSNNASTATNRNPIQIDSTITGFKLANISENGIVYTPNGSKDLRSEFQTSGFNVIPMNNMPLQKATEFLEYMMSTYKDEGSIIENLKKNDTTINGRKVLETSFLVKDRSQKVRYVYQAVISKNNVTLAFMGMDVEEGKLITKFEKTLRTIVF